MCLDPFAIKTYSLTAYMSENQGSGGSNLSPERGPGSELVRRGGGFKHWTTRFSGLPAHFHLRGCEGGGVGAYLADNPV